MSECCNVYGGVITIEIDGKRFSARGDITIEPTNIEVEGEANSDGSAYYVQKPRLYRASMNLSNPCGFVWNDSIRKCAINATIDEADNGRQHLFTSCRIVGKVSLNLSTGEVQNFAVAGGSYRVVGG
jgi:hypothetical protein